MQSLMPSFRPPFAAPWLTRVVVAGTLATCASTAAPHRARAGSDVPSKRPDVSAPCVATIEPSAPIVADGPATLAFRFEATGAGLAKGDTLEIRSCSALHTKRRWPDLSLDGEQPGRTVGAERWTRHGPFPLDPTPRSPCSRIDTPRSHRGSPKALARQRRRVVTYGDPGPDGRGAAIAQAFPEEDVPFRFRVRPHSGGPPLDVPRQGPPLSVGRRACERLHLSGPSEARRGKQMTFLVAALDKFGFPGSDFPSSVRLVATHESGAKAGPFPADREARDPCTRRAEVTLNRDGVWWLSAEASGKDAPWELPVLVGSSGPLTLVFGDLHWHTNRSDGSRSPQEGYRYARDVVGLDFTSKTDHDVHYTYPCLTDATGGIEGPGRNLTIRRFAVLPG
jgi:hypothetical protein